MHISNPDTLNREQFEEFMNDASGSLDLMTPEQLHKVKKIYERIAFLDKIEKARTNFRTFVELCGPSYLKFSSKGQHDEMAEEFERVVDGDEKRVTISMSPRFGKSEFGSICLPAWYIGKYPTNKIIQASAKDTIAADFGRKVKMIMDHPMYKLVFPGVSISKDSRASGKFATTKGGTYFAVGVNSGVAGLGADLLICLHGDEPVFGLFKKWKIKDLFACNKLPFVITRGRIGLPEIRRIKSLCKNKSTLMTAVKTKDWESKCTPNHPFFVECQGMTRADQLKAGDVLVSLRWPILSSVAALILTALLNPIRLLKRKESLKSGSCRRLENGRPVIKKK